jgi:hypothetical protein
VYDHILAQTLVQKLTEVSPRLTLASEGMVKEMVAGLRFEDVTTFYYAVGALAAVYLVNWVRAESS